MKILNLTSFVVLLFASTWTVLGDEQTNDKVEVPLCPMVASPAKEGLFQLIEVIGKDGVVGVGAPGETVRLKCTIVNLTKRPLMVAADYFTPQHGSMEVYVEGRDREYFPEAKVPAITPKSDLVMSSSVDFPMGQMDWGHIRDWIHIAASHDTECGCCIRHRQYTRWLDLKMPEGDWTTIDLELSQRAPAIFLSPQENAKLESALVLTIKRRSEQAGTEQPAPRPESKSEGEDKPKSESEGRPR